MRVKRFSTYSAIIAKSALTRGYRLASIAYWCGSSQRMYTLYK